MKTSFSSPSPTRSIAARRLVHQDETRLIVYDESRPFLLSPWAASVTHNLKGHNGLYQSTITFEYPVGDIADAKAHVDLIVRPEQRDTVTLKHPRYPYHYRKAEMDTYDIKDRAQVPAIHEVVSVNRKAQMKLMVDQGEMYEFTDVKLPWKVLENLKREVCASPRIDYGAVRVNGETVKVENVVCICLFRLTIENSALSVDDLTATTEGWEIKGDP
jgi:hypothetical protein